MADKVDVKVMGIEKAVRSLKKYQFVKSDATKRMLKITGFKIEGDAKIKAPVDTGRLKSSISTNWSSSSMNKGKTGAKAKAGDGVGRPRGKPGLVVVVGSNVKYAPYQELGTRKMAAHPYLYPAYWMHKMELAKDLAKVFKKK